MPLSSLMYLARRWDREGSCPRYSLFTRVLKRRNVTAVTILLGFAVLSGGALAADPPRLMILGDSLTAGYGLPQDQAFPVRLEAALRAKGRTVAVINAGVSGDTTAGGLARLDWALAANPTHVLVELGANDMLRAVDPGVTRKNLDAIVTKLKARGINVMLAGMYASPNLGKTYTEAFKGLYTDLAAKHGVRLYPFFLDGVAAERGLNQDDGIHPNEKGVAVIVKRILPSIEKFLGEKE
jgi:acyl-CoA thioesterase-1